MSVKEKKITGTESVESLKGIKKLILFNDDVNTFDYVISTLVEVLGHDIIQAENCAWIAHYKGKCPVKNGSFEQLKPYYNEMTNRKLTVEIL
jgi:ATP-dependent Clp protease adaptor protein ClpS